LWIPNARARGDSMTMMIPVRMTPDRDPSGREVNQSRSTTSASNAEPALTSALRASRERSSRRTGSSSRNTASSSCSSYSERISRLLEPAQAPVLYPGRFDREVAAHGEIDDRGGVELRERYALAQGTSSAGLTASGGVN